MRAWRTVGGRSLAADEAGVELGHRVRRALSHTQLVEQGGEADVAALAGDRAAHAESDCPPSLLILKGIVWPPF